MSVSESVFTHAEIEYLGSRPPRAPGDRRPRRTPHVAPVGMFSHNAGLDVIEIGGHDLRSTKKFRDAALTGRAALEVDDLASTDPFRPRGIEVRGRAETIIEGPEPVIRLHPERVVAWGIDTGGFERNGRSVG